MPSVTDMYEDGWNILVTNYHRSQTEIEQKVTAELRRRGIEYSVRYEAYDIHGDIIPGFKAILVRSESDISGVLSVL